MFKVLRIIDGITIEVSPQWLIETTSGSLVKIVGYSAGISDEKGMSFAANKLVTLLDNKTVELKNPAGINTEGILSCSVYLNGVDIAQYFPEFKTNVPT